MKKERFIVCSTPQGDARAFRKIVDVAPPRFHHGIRVEVGAHGRRLSGVIRKTELRWTRVDRKVWWVWSYRIEFKQHPPVDRAEHDVQDAW